MASFTAPSVVGVILAAGQSSRMGQSKALLHDPHTGSTFVSQLLRSFREAGIERIVVVVRSGDAALRAEVAGAGVPVACLENPAPELGQLSSLLLGIQYAEAHHAAGALVVPVDMPLIRAGTVRAALDAFACGHHPIVRVTHRGQNGHPVVFGAGIFAALRSADPAQGARSVIREQPERVRNLEVDDPGVVRDIDLPAEYRSLFNRDPV